MSSDFEIKISLGDDAASPEEQSLPKVEKIQLELPTKSVLPPVDKTALLVGFVSNTSIQTAGAPQKGSITLLDTHIKVPEVVVPNWELNKFRSGFSVETITRFDPNSLEFESSINWDSLNPGQGKFLNQTSLLKTGDTPLWAGGVASSELVKNRLSRLKNSTFSYRSMEHDLSLLVTPNIISKKEYGEVMGRICARDERFWEMEGHCTKTSFKSYMQAVLSSWASSDYILNGSDCLSAGFIEINRRASATTYESIRGYRNRLINVFEIYEGTPAICLSFIEFITSNSKGATAKPESWCGRVYHIWIRPNIPMSLEVEKSRILSDSSVIMFKDHTSPPSYILGGLPRLAWKLYVSSLGLDPEDFTINIETDFGVVRLNLDTETMSSIAHNYSYNFNQFSKWGKIAPVGASFALEGYFIREAFGLAYVPGSQLSLMQNCKLSSIKNFDILRKILSKRTPAPMYDTGLTSEDTLRKEIPKFVEGFHSAIKRSTLVLQAKEYELSMKLTALSKNNTIRPGESFAGFTRRLAQPEFRANLGI